MAPSAAPPCSYSDASFSRPLPFPPRQLSKMRSSCIMRRLASPRTLHRACIMRRLASPRTLHRAPLRVMVHSELATHGGIRSRSETEWSARQGLGTMAYMVWAMVYDGIHGLGYGIRWHTWYDGIHGTMAYMVLWHTCSGLCRGSIQRQSWAMMAGRRCRLGDACLHRFLESFMSLAIIEPRSIMSSISPAPNTPVTPANTPGRARLRHNDQYSMQSEARVWFTERYFPACCQRRR